VLLVDDDPSLVQAVRIGLESHGYPVVTARDGNEGLERLRSEHPCVVLLDLDMPGMNGWQFIERQQADPRTASVRWSWSPRGTMRLARHACCGLRPGCRSPSTSTP
jgi:CheY-like chemotaxis protein